MVVHAPSFTTSPSASGTGVFGGIGPGRSPTTVPLVDSRSTTSQPPSSRLTSSACNADTPGSTGGADRSISGEMPRERLWRPIAICGPSSTNRRSVLNAGNRRLPASGPLRRQTSSNQARSARTTAVHKAPGDRRAVGDPVVSGGTAVSGLTGATAASGGGPRALSYPQTSQNRPSRTDPQRAQCSAVTVGAGGSAGPPRPPNPQTAQYS